MRCTELTLMPSALAIIAAVQWVTSAGGAVRVRATVRSCTAVGSRGMRDGRVLWRRSPGDPFRREPLLPAPDGHHALARPPHDRTGANAIRRQQHDLRSANVLLRAVAIRHDRHQTRPIGIAHLNRDPPAHARPSQGCDEHTPIGDSYVRLYTLE